MLRGDMNLTIMNLKIMNLEIMNLKIRSGTVVYNNKLLISDGTFNLGENDKVNTSELGKEGDKPKMSHKVVVQPAITHKNLAQKRTTVTSRI